MAALAGRFGGTPLQPRIEPGPLRTLDEVAIDNAAEGCVRETFGALVGMWQARFASDPAVRNTMTRIARDESRHAALSWEIADWLEPRISPATRRRLEAARRDAIEQLEKELRSAPEAGVVQVAGVPTAGAARLLLARLRESLWERDERRSVARSSTATLACTARVAAS
jgi:hypothetical protein